MSTYTYPESQKLFQRAARVIPGGIYGHFSPAPLVPPTAYPFYTDRAKGSRIWDVDGNEFIDYMCAYGPMILGYGHPGVEEAAAAQLGRGNLTTGAPAVMVELAEYLTTLVPFAGWAFFAKNGGDVTNFAVMVARDATERKKVVMIKGGYHGVAGWMQAPGHHGPIEEDQRHIIRIPWNDTAAFERVVEANPGQIAAFIATPYFVPVFADNELPADGYWERIESLCRREGILLVLDDIRHGFRLSLAGSHAAFGFTPDLLCIGKAMANGYPISALLGRPELKQVAARVFHTGSFWFEAVPMAAALATLKELKRLDAPQRIADMGERLLEGLSGLAHRHGFSLKASGSPAMPYLRITDDESMMLHQDWCAECTRRGAYFTPHHNWFLSTAHAEEDLGKTFAIADAAFQTLRRKREPASPASV